MLLPSILHPSRALASDSGAEVLVRFSPGVIAFPWVDEGSGDAFHATLEEADFADTTSAFARADPREPESEESERASGRGTWRIRFAPDRSCLGRVVVYDVLGRAIRVLEESAFVPRGGRTFFWNGTDKLGRKVPSGVYFAALQAGGRRLAHRIQVVR